MCDLCVSNYEYLKHCNREHDSSIWLDPNYVVLAWFSIYPHWKHTIEPISQESGCDEIWNPESIVV